MTSALAHHIWLLLTFRHDLRGLRPSGLPMLVFVLLLACLVAAVRHAYFGATGLCAVLWFALVVGSCAAWFSPRAAVAMCLISIGVDAVLIAAFSAWRYSLSVGALGDLWQLAALLSAGLRAGR